MTSPAQPTFLRNQDGLLANVEYYRDALNRVDWRKMIHSQYLYVSPDYQVEAMVRQNVKSKWDIDVTKCEDKELLITLSGLKYLAHLRGIRAIHPPILHATSTEVVCSCSIEFEPNFENPDGLISSGAGTASLYNVSGKFQLYLSSMAHNRALTRAIKDALRIEILGADEVDFKASAAFEKSLKDGDNPLISKPVHESAPTETSYKPSPTGLLNRVCDENGISFEKLKGRAIELREELEYAKTIGRGEKMNESFDPANWTGFNEESIAGLDALTLIDKINAAKTGKKAKKKA